MSVAHPSVTRVSEYYSWDLSPDGSHLAFMQYDPHQGLIRVLSLASGQAREVNVEGRENLAELRWTEDGRGLFVGGEGEVGTLFYVDLEGRAQVLLPPNDQHTPNRGFGQGIIPSPDGRYLALSGRTDYGNVWLLENF